MNRNKRYEQRMKENGFKKITIWVPSDRESDVKQHRPCVKMKA